MDSKNIIDMLRRLEAEWRRGIDEGSMLTYREIDYINCAYELAALIPQIEAALRPVSEPRQKYIHSELIESGKDLLEYLDEHNWGTIPEGKISDRFRHAVEIAYRNPADPPAGIEEAIRSALQKYAVDVDAKVYSANIEKFIESVKPAIESAIAAAEEALYWELESAIRTHFKKNAGLQTDAFFALQSAFTLCLRGKGALARHEAEARMDQLKRCREWHAVDIEPHPNVLHIPEHCYECEKYQAELDELEATLSTLTGKGS